HEIFEPFVQAIGGLSRPHDGAGLGLAISRDMAQAMLGELRMADAEERRVADALGFHGAAFLLSLPSFA
ncbi:MAG TPA: hypothetical protein VE861_05825, partial [Gemmatimonadaceae bacterium]|nr:hypothetical protein [Gemmatimonadaceae bacterium]